LTTTKMRAGPGTRIAGLGGICETWRTADPSELAVKVELLSRMASHQSRINDEDKSELTVERNVDPCSLREWRNQDE